MDQSILLSSFSKEERQKYNIAQNTNKVPAKVPLGEEGLREIDLAIIIMVVAPIFFGQLH